MTDRDWDAEMKKIDREMERSTARPSAASAPLPAPGAATAAGVPSRPFAGAPVAAPATTGFGVYARLTLAVSLGVGIVFWPYAARCGAGLAAYLGAVTALFVAGVWSAIWTWRHRASRAHVLSLLLVMWGLVLAGIDVLPRAGYAVPTAARPATWSCTA